MEEPDNKGKRVNVNKQKREVLELSLIYPSQWGNMICELNTSIERRKDKKIDAVWKSWGELCQIHGCSEAHDNLRKGKWHMEKDAWGDSMYRKVIASKSRTTTHKKKASIVKKVNMDPNADNTRLTQASARG